MWVSLSSPGFEDIGSTGACRFLQIFIYALRWDAAVLIFVSTSL